MLRQGRHPAATIYESLGADFFLALAPGWLNLGLWEGPGDAAEAAAAPRRLVETLCEPLPPGGVILDVGNGLGVQDLVVAERLRPSRLVTLNLSEFQLRAGRRALNDAEALPVVGDAVHLPIATRAVDGLLSVEAAFHFPSRAAFYAEARRVLCPGGVLSMSDILAPRMARDPLELFVGAANMRIWGLRPAVVAGPDEIARLLRMAGFVDVAVQTCGAAVFDPALRFARQRLRQHDLDGVPRGQQWAARLMIPQYELLRRRGMLEYILAQAVAP
ncbi:MAG: class I SAM-dependent methyltransferase [Egibacteraceae bacterium]